MPVRLDLDFPRSYDLSLRDELPGGRSGPDVVYFPSGSLAGGQDGLIVTIKPRSQEEYIGVFAFGHLAPFTGIVGLPNPDRFCVCSRGLGYVVTAANRSAETIELPVWDAMAFPAQGIVVFRDAVGFFAYGREGIAWKTVRLAFDDLKVETVSWPYLAGSANDPRLPHRVPFRVDLRTGRHWGGASPGGHHPPIRSMDVL